MLDFLFPKECLVCLKTGLWLCKTCQKRLYPTLPSCYICKKLSNDFKTHSLCIKEDSFESIITLWKYNECSRKLIHNFKYKNRFQVANFIFSLFESKLKKINFKNSLLIPLPSHRKKTLERGFNPTELLCELIAQKVNTQINTNLIFKKQENLSQASLDYEKRGENVKNVFEINTEAIGEIEKYDNIIIVDDIITTGATMNEISKEIKKNLEREISLKGICLFQGTFRKKK